MLEIILDVTAAVVGTAYCVGIIVFSLAGVISSFGGWQR